jgi:hypothetical protein
VQSRENRIEAQLRMMCSMAERGSGLLLKITEDALEQEEGVFHWICILSLTLTGHHTRANRYL